MMSSGDVELARAAFEARAKQLCSVDTFSAIRRVTEPAYLVPGFATFEATIEQVPLRGWARPDGTVALVRQESYGPVLEALGFGDPATAIDAGALARMLVWGYGDGTVPIDHVPKGMLGAHTAVDLRPSITRHPDGTTEFTAGLHDLPLPEEPEAECVLQLRAVRMADGRYDIELVEIAPLPDDDDDDDDDED